MSEFIFNSKKLKDGISLARTIKPDSGDFNVKFIDSSIVILSLDKRRCAKVVIQSDSSSDFESSDMRISFDRISLLETELDSISISINEKSLSIKIIGDGQARRASIAKKISKTKVIDPSLGIDKSKFSMINSKKFDQLLRQVSCSALIKETKTEQDMRVNQVHFYPDKNCVTSNARYYGSVAFLDGMGLDLSIISSDIPFIRTFCSKCDGDVGLMCDDNKLYISDDSSGSMMVFSRIVIPKPTLTLFDSSDFGTEVHIDRDQLLKSLVWASSAIEGTQRLGVHATKSDDNMKLFFGQEEIANFPVSFISGNEIKSDFPLNVLMNVVNFIDKVVVFKFHHKDAQTMLEVSQKDTDLRSMHYLQSMRTR